MVGVEVEIRVVQSSGEIAQRHRLLGENEPYRVVERRLVGESVAEQRRQRQLDGDHADAVFACGRDQVGKLLEITLSLIHISEPTRLGMISYAVFCLKKNK